MILFYDKNTGDIVGTIEGRIHDDKQLEAWIGEPSQIGRIVCQWQPVMVVVQIEGRSFDASWKSWTEWLEKEQSKPVAQQRSYKVRHVIHEPQHSQKELFTQLDRNPTGIYDYRIDPQTLQIIPKNG